MWLRQYQTAETSLMMRPTAEGESVAARAASSFQSSLVARGFQDLQDYFASAPSPSKSVRGPQSGGKTPAGTVTGAGGGGGGRPFAEAWKKYSSTNARLRDPRALPLLVRQGIPDSFRREVWLHCLGMDAAGAAAGEAIAAEEPTCDISGGDFDDVIEADVARTFPNNKAFQEMDGPAKLRRVLRKMAVEDADLGYCQSLNFVAATLLQVLETEHLVSTAVGKLILKLSIRSWYKDGMQQLRADTAVLEDLIQERLPAIYEVFHSQKFDLLFVSSKWFMCLFTTMLDDDALRRAWDVILCDGIEAVFRIALALVASRSRQILAVKSADDLIEMFQRRLSEVTGEALIRSAYDADLVGQLNRTTLAQRRKDAVEKVASTDNRTELRRIQLARGGVRPASILNR